MTGSAEPDSANILIADDDPEILAILRRRLRDVGYHTIEAVDGEEALTLARAHSPDVVILDVMMPKKNGWEVARELRADPLLADVGILVLTAIGARVNEITSPLYDVDDYLDKPFEFETLDAKVANVLVTRRTRRR